MSNLKGHFSGFFLLIILVITGCTSDQKHNSQHVNDSSSADHQIGDVQAGKSVFATCIACHGEKAEGNKSLYAPGLVNLDEWYLVRQLENYQKGIRGNDPEDNIGYQMGAIAKTLDDRKIKDVVAYIKSLPAVKPQATIEGDSQEGKKYYQMICGACHGPEGVGNKALNSPSLVGIDDWYLKRQLLLFKEGKRGTHPEDTYGKQMQAISVSLDEKTIDNIIAYLNTLNNAN